ncbi:MAG: RNA polymerase sigma-70 factor [Gemmatimonadaceae bacterium]
MTPAERLPDDTDSVDVPPAADDGPAATFRRLVEQYQESLRRYAQRFVRSRAVAEDLVQEVFLNLWRRRDVVDLGVSIRSYLFTATRSRAIGQLRRDRLEGEGRKRYVPPQWVNEGAALPPEGDLRAEADEVKQAIKRVLDEMPPRQRDAATLRLRDQLSTAEIAKRLGISSRTVEGHILRAAKMMRERLPEILGKTPREE